PGRNNRDTRDVCFRRRTTKPFRPHCRRDKMGNRFNNNSPSAGSLKEASMNNFLAVILAGGKGERLEPLTRDRAKPAVPFGGSYRIIDFTLSNCLTSGLRKMLVLTQYKAMSLDRHINLGWRGLLCRELGEFI